MYTRTTTIIERSDIASILFYRWKEGAYFVTFTDCKSTYAFTGKYSGGENVEGKLYKFKKGGYGSHRCGIYERQCYECNPVHVE